MAASQTYGLLSLAPDGAADFALRRTAEAYRALSAWLDAQIPAGQSANLVELHRRWYERARQMSPLPAQMVTLALRDWSVRRRGEAVDGVPYDRKLFAVRGIDAVSLSTVLGRVDVPCALAGYVAGAGMAPARLLDRPSGWALMIEVSPDLATMHGRTEVMTSESVIARVGRVITGLAHAAVSAAEQIDPAGTLDQAIREIDGAADEVRTELGAATAERYRLDQRLQELLAERGDLDGKVRLAVASNRDDLARAGIARQLDIESQCEVLTRLRGDVEQRVDKLEATLAAVRASRREAEERLRQLRRSQAEPTGAARRTAASPIDRAAAKVERAQAAIERVTGVPGEPGPKDADALEALGNLKREQAIQDRLAQLKSAGS